MHSMQDAKTGSLTKKRKKKKLPEKRNAFKQKQ